MSELDIACLKLRLAIDRGSGIVLKAASPKKDEARQYVALKSAAIRKSKRSADLVSRARRNLWEE